MRILFTSGFAHLPQGFGGIASSTHELACELQKHGHSPAVAADHVPSDLLGLRTRLLGRLTSKAKVHDRMLGYPTYRRWDVAEDLAGIVEDFRPDVVIMHPSDQIKVARELRRLSIPGVFYFRDVEFDLLDGDPRDVGPMPYLANSQFTAQRFQEKFGIEATVVPPLFKAEKYRTAKTQENVTFVNPRPIKGVELALALVERCPEIPFSFVESWVLPKNDRDAMLEFIKHHPNLKFVPRTDNMKEIYRRAKIILMPSQWEEAWGRIASEAQFSGTPVVASKRGGLPESVGPGGVLLDPDGPIEAWVEALRRLWHDNAHYAEVSAAALAYADRPQIDPAVQVNTLVSVAQRAIELHRAA
jgi:glycosyltransferase involved in cell wall biosynthesis